MSTEQVSAETTTKWRQAFDAWVAKEIGRDANGEYDALYDTFLAGWTAAMDSMARVEA